MHKVSIQLLAIVLADGAGLVIHGFSLHRPHHRISHVFAVRSTRPTHWHFSSTSENASSVETTDAEGVQDLIELGRCEMQQYFKFPLDDWQLHAGGAICQGYNVVCCSPTGSGKTAVGEMALHHAMVAGQKGIYTTPLKALSNQKYFELCETFGRAHTGLSTGDISINKGARITVMTTEVYRNIAWRSSTPTASILGTDELLSNAVVVLDEFHYMGYPGRGGVWEESCITSPPHTQIVGLSATLANGPAIAGWLESVTGRKTCLVNVPSEKRPVPLRYLFATREGLFPLFRDPDAGPGAPHGLLGFRGEGIAKNEKQTEKKGFDKKAETKSDKLPKGLQVNPALRAAAEQRLQKVNRSLDRQRTRYSLTESDNNSNDQWGGGGRRSRPVEQAPRKMSPREERREKERLLRNEMRRAVPSVAALVRRLNQKDLLPAIFFIFSRNGCDDAARSVYQAMTGPRDPTALLEEEFAQFGVDNPRPQRRARQRGRRRGPFVEDAEGRTFRSKSNYIDESILASLAEDDVAALDAAFFDDDTSPLSPKKWDYFAKAGLLDYNQIRDVASRISLFNERNPEIAFDDETIEQFLFGVGSHHAGMLPAHKSLVEILYQNQLMKVVFATETLAAGINMPARTTVVCSMAKRGDGSSMNLLETSNLLQMAGRAGRRGYDTEGTCVIVATPFETHEDASKILTDPIKPIRSQFSPSYSLSVNLIERGQGRLDVARELVSKSFAMWEKRQVDERIQTAVENNESLNELMLTSSQERFMNALQHILQIQVDRRRAKFDIGRLQSLLEILIDKESLKKTSKSYLSMSQMLKLEESTLSYLEKELTQLMAQDTGDEILAELANEDRASLFEQVETQQMRVMKTEKELRKHPFSIIVDIANEIMAEASPEGEMLLNSLRSARDFDEASPLTAVELSDFSKSAIVIQRKTRKLTTENPDLDPQTFLQEAESAETMIRDGSWDDMLAIVKTLVAYGCVQVSGEFPEDQQGWEKATYSITNAGANVGMLGFENSLWALVAMGGAWDVIGASSNLDRFRRAMDAMDANDSDGWYDDEDDKDDHNEGERKESVNTPSAQDFSEEISFAQQEAETILSLIRQMTPAELAGYVAAIVGEGSRASGGASVVELFHNLTPLQQRVVQSSLQALERFAEVQKTYNVDSGTRNSNLDISNVQVVTAWADGCTWNEALSLSNGLPPGDLARTFSRVLDAVRQLGNLPFTPVRKEDFGGSGSSSSKRISRGIHPEVRRLCRDAAAAINRYPVKDPFSFEQGEEDDEEEEAEDDEDGERMVSG